MNRKMLLIIPIIAVAIVAAFVLNGTLVVNPTNDVIDLPDVEGDVAPYAYVQVHGGMAKKLIPATAYYYATVRGLGADVYSELPPAPLWMTKATKGNDIKLVMTLTSMRDPEIHATTNVTYAYADLITILGNTGQTIPTTSIGGYFAVASAGDYNLHVDGLENINGVWQDMIGNSANDDGFYDVTVTVP